MQSTVNGVNSTINRLSTVVNNIQNIQDRGTVKSVQRGRVYIRNSYPNEPTRDITINRINIDKSVVLLDGVAFIISSGVCNISDGTASIELLATSMRVSIRSMQTGTIGEYNWQVIEFY